jgi:hypothetical protein
MKTYSSHEEAIDSYEENQLFVAHHFPYTYHSMPVQELFTLLQKQPCSYHEYIFPYCPVKIFMDCEIATTVMDISTFKTHVQVHIGQIKQAVGRSTKQFNCKHYTCTSFRADKHSVHVIFDTWVREARRLSGFIESTCGVSKVIDYSVYSKDSVKTLRTPLSYKNGQNIRMKYPCIYPNMNIFEEFQNRLLTSGEPKYIELNEDLIPKEQMKKKLKVEEHTYMHDALNRVIVYVENEFGVTCRVTKYPDTKGSCSFTASAGLFCHSIKARHTSNQMKIYLNLKSIDSLQAYMYCLDETTCSQSHKQEFPVTLRFIAYPIDI